MKYPSSEFDHAVASLCHDTCDDNELNELHQLLQIDPAAMDEYLWRIEVHGELTSNCLLFSKLGNSDIHDGNQEISSASETHLTASAETHLAPVRSEVLSGWSKLTTIAAGMLIGIFGASIVWANTIPLLNRSLRESKEIVFESFEDPEIKISGRFPTNANRWFGGMVSVPEEDGMPAVEGTRVGKLKNIPNVRFTNARYIVDLDDHAEPSDEYTRSIEVSGSFFSTDPDPSSIYRIDLWAFSQTPEEIQPIWTDREHFQDNVLQQVGRNYTPELIDQPTWHKVKVTMEIPPGARSIVVSLGSGKRSPGGANSDRYLDDVRVHLVDTITHKD